MKNKSIKTERLILRPWQESDLKPFAELNADPLVREFFPSTLNSHESDALVTAFSAHIEKHGWGFWAASLIETDEFLGFIGLQEVNYLNEPAVEIGW